MSVKSGGDIDHLAEMSRSVARDGGLIVVAGATMSGKTTVLRAVAKGLAEGGGGARILSIQEDNEQWAESSELSVAVRDEAVQKWAAITAGRFDVVAIDEGFLPTTLHLLERAMLLPFRPLIAVAINASTGKSAVAYLRHISPFLRDRPPFLAVTTTEQRDGTRTFSYVVQK